MQEEKLPYFKFYVSKYMNGAITLLDGNVQGLFINICCHYWFKLGNVKFSEIKVRLEKFDDEQFKILIEKKMIKVKGDKIKISFLDDQLQSFENQSEQNKKNGKLGGRPRVKRNESETKPTALISESEKKAKKSNIEERREEEMREEEKGVFAQDFFETKEQAFDELRDNEMYIEESQMSLSGRGWKTVTALDVIGLLKYFLLSKTEMPKARGDLKRHFKNWISSGNTKLEDLVTKAEVFKKNLQAA